MTILRTKEIDGMSSEDRAKKVTELRAELSRLRTMIGAGGAVENPARVRELRKAIAKTLTIEHEYKLGIRGKKAEEKSAKKEAKKETKEAKPEEKKKK
jgi:large subunit ribosomal protein L29